MAQLTQDELWQSMINQLSLNKIRVTPYRGTNRVIEQMPCVDGAIYFAYDTGKIFLDKEITEDGETTVKRFLMSSSSGGPSSAGYCYSDADEDEGTLVKEDPTVDDYDDPYYFIYRSAFDESMLSLPDVDTLIINSNGWFFRTIEPQGALNRVRVKIIAAAGSGGGGGGGGGATVEDDLDLSFGNGWGKGRTYIYGQENPLEIIGICTRGNNPDVDITITVVNNVTSTIVSNETYVVTSGESFFFDTSTLPVSSNLSITVSLDSGASRMRPAYKPTRTFDNIVVFRMDLTKTDENEYLPLRGSDSAEAVATHTLNFIATGAANTTEILHVYIDNEELVGDGFPKTLRAETDGRSQNIQIPEQPHGVHDVTLQMTTTINNITLTSNSITYQCAWMSAAETTPIVWIGNYDPLIVNYEYSYIKYMVYDPLVRDGDAGAEVLLYKNGTEIGQVVVNYSDHEWISWDITALYDVGPNVFSVSCRGVKVDLNIEVTNEGSRDLSLAESGSLLANYSTTGRSNDEIASTKITFTSSTALANSSATLTNFNWQNNGWRNDNALDAKGIDNGSFLNIANGAGVTIPIPTNNQKLLLNSTISYSFEIRFRISNVQQYSTLVKTIPTYFYIDGEGKKSSTAIPEAEIIANGWTIALDEYGNKEGDEEHQLKEIETTEGIVVKWLNGNNYGLCLGTQEAYFSTPSGVVNVRYCEDEVINISFVVDVRTHLCYIYLNGILSGAVDLPNNEIAGNQFLMETPFVINSNYCDFDLYRFRIYQTGLSMPNVIHNYLSDMHSIVLYDQNNLTRALDPTELDFDSLMLYNYGDATNNIPGHPGALSMPYCVFTIEDATDIFPRYKGNKKKCSMDFCNPSLDEAYDNGEITDWYYYTHSPSYHATGVEINVQGTSSQKYPRRNWKTAFKKAKTWTFAHGPLMDLSLNDKHYFDSNGKYIARLEGESEEDYETRAKTVTGYKTLSKKFHMDNETYGTNKFTWKIDYMESSGSYNTGMANMMGNKGHPLYSKHPLNDIGKDDTDLRTSVYGYPVLGFQKFLDPANNDNYEYRYVGRYNMNLDKSSNEYYGYELEEEHPFITLGDGTHPLIKDVAECWELRDNQGTWCSFRYPSPAARLSGFRTLVTDTSGDNAQLEIIKHFEYRYSNQEDNLDSAYDYVNFTDENNVVRETRASIINYLVDKYSNLEVLFNWLDSTDRSDPTLISKALLTNPAGPWQTLEAGSDTGEVSVPVYTYTKLGDSALYNENTTYYTYANGEYTEANITSFLNYQAVASLMTGKNYYKFVNDEYVQLEPSEIIDGSSYIQADENNQFILVGTDTPIYIYESYRPDYYIKEIDYYNTTFYNDTSMYRLYKFKNEFSEHLDKEYCLVYFIMTEILLCYDSRGKNMMLATFGPQREGGAYVWYPVFYDIDTQLGLNNSGAYLWDYDEDVTENNTFSTPNSVLWNNFYEAFYNDIVYKYRALRVNDLNYNTIVGAYECDSSVFDSYAMKGLRPIIAIGLDEYYKYIAPTTTGYYTTTENDDSLKFLDGYTYAYACQGDKKLTTELLIKNRLNYLDSRWLAGAYTDKTVLNEIFIRANANQTGTSDTFFDATSYNNNPATMSAKAISRGFTLKDYDIDNGLDARAGYKIKPYLHQYVTYFVDNQPVSSIKYTGGEGQEDGIYTNVSPDVLTAYKKTLDVSQQINYIPAADYISSLGNLSLSYPNAIQIFTGKKLLDLNIGSDNPDYKNTLLNAQSDFSIPALPLLLTANLSHLTEFNRAIDLSSSAKLREFKALDSTLTTVTFAPGAPLHTILLPRTLSLLTLVGHQELTNIITSVPQPIIKNPETGVYEQQPADSYKGLYIENVTDYTQAKAGQGHSLGTIQIDGGKLEYGSYKILDNLVKLKTNAQQNMDLSIFYYNVHWSPYNKVEKGTVYDESVTYYELNDHGLYKRYAYTTADAWANALVNEIVYTYDENAEKETITNLNLLDSFITQYDYAIDNSRINQFHGTVATYATMPIITGDLYVDNSDVAEAIINEAELTSKWKVYYPNLNISAARVAESYVTKYVNLLASGKEEIVDIKRSNNIHPQMLTALPPGKTNYDFRGWALDSAGEHMFISYDPITQQYQDDYNDILEEYSFTNENKILKLYAIFTIHSFTMRFYNSDGATLLETNYNAYSVNPGLIEPHVVPSKDSISADLDLTETYKWIGWARKLDPKIVVDLNKITPTADIDFVAVYETSPSSVYDNVLSMKYLDYGPVTGGYALGLNGNYSLSGKITLPTQSDGVPVVQAGDDIRHLGGLTADNSITHVFWADPPTAEHPVSQTRALVTIYANAFSAMPALRYFEQVSTCRNIGASAFANCPLLGADDPLVIKEILTPVTSLENAIFAGNTVNTLYLPGHSYTSLSARPFGSFSVTKYLVIGGEGDPCTWENMVGAQLTASSQLFNGFYASYGGGQYAEVTIYTADGEEPSSLIENGIYKYFGFGSPSVSIVRA